MGSPRPATPETRGALHDVVAFALVLVVLSVAPEAQTSRELFPHTRDRGRAAVEYDDGRAIPTASQAAFARDLPRVRSLLLRAETTRHGITGYFSRQRLRNVHFFTLPFEGVAYDVFDVDRWQVAWGDLFFAAPSGAWDAGTHALVVGGSGNAVARLPIDLE